MPMIITSTSSHPIEKKIFGTSNNHIIGKSLYFNDVMQILHECFNNKYFVV